MRVGFIGSVGVPNIYGGFESFLETCTPWLAKKVSSIFVTCDATRYNNRFKFYKGFNRIFIPIAATGWTSSFHDLVAFFAIFFRVDKIVVLGVSAGPLFFLMRILCSIFSKELIVNIDGVEWRRDKFSNFKKLILRVFDFFAQRFAHKIILDNLGLQRFVYGFALSKVSIIAYPGDYSLRFYKKGVINPGVALTICRIEPENNLDLMISAVEKSSVINKYYIIGNWDNSIYSKKLKERVGKIENIYAIDAIYDPEVIGEYRSICEFYLHGHSVGGTNPSLVEMLYSDAKIIAYDCIFNRETAAGRAIYFDGVEKMVSCIDNIEKNEFSKPLNDYSTESICNKYLKLFGVDTKSR